MNRRGLVRTITIMALAISTLTACGEPRSTGPSNHLNSSGFRADIGTWSLPLDAFIVDQRELAHAQDVLYANCMRANGFAVQTYDISDYVPPTRNRVLRKLFNPALAATYGYHSGPTRKDPAQLPKPNLATTQAQQQDQECMRDSAAELDENAGLIAYVQHLEGQAESAADADPAVRSAMLAWQTCMRPLGVIDLPESPDDMPSPSQRQAFGLTESIDPGPGQLPKATQPTASEIRQASYDAQCRNTSGYSTKLYDTEFRIEQNMITNDNGGQLAEAQQTERHSAALVATTLRAP